MDRAALVELADACERASGSCRALDGKIASAQGWQRIHSIVGGAMGTKPGDRNPTRIPKFTASLNAAMSLCPEGKESELLHEACVRLGRERALHIRLWKREVDGDYAQALALFVCAASLRALAVQGGE